MHDTTPAELARELQFRLACLIAHVRRVEAEPSPQTIAAMHTGAGDYLGAACEAIGMLARRPDPGQHLRRALAFALAYRPVPAPTLPTHAPTVHPACLHHATRVH